MKRSIAISLSLALAGAAVVAQEPAGAGPGTRRYLGGPAPCPSGGTQLIGTPPDQFFLYISDANFPQVMAVQVTLPDTTLGELVFYGAHSPFPSTPAGGALGPFTFRALVRADAGGLPGAILSDQPAIVPSSFVPTGVIVFDVPEMEVVLPLAPVPLAPGIYWIEIFAETLVPGEFWHWETGGPVDPNQSPAGAFAFDVPGSVWLPLAGTLAITVCDAGVIAVELTEFSVE